MKKFFRMVSMFVLAGATLAYTGCTDYDEDIEAINDRIDMLETGKLKTVEEQVASLNTTVKNLQDAQSKAQSAIEALQSTLGALQTKHDADIKALEEAYKAADASLKTSIENQIKTLTDQFNSKVNELNTAISGLQSSVEAINGKISSIEATIKTLATKEYVDATFATKQAVADLETELGKLSARLEIAEKSISTIQGQISDLQDADKKLDEAVKAAQKAADDAQTAADKAQGTADAALGTVTALQEALGAYAVQGALEAKIAALMEMDEELDEKKFNTADFQKTFDKAFDTALDAALAADGKINKEIASQIAAAKKILDDKIDAVESALNARIDKVLGVIEGRLTSIAFVPQYYYDGVPAILFETIVYNALDDKNEDEVIEYDYSKWDNNSLYANEYNHFASALATAKYRLNPRNVGSDCADFSFVGDKADYVFTRSEAPKAPVSVVGVPSYDEKTGYVIFQVAKNEKINVTDNDDKNLDIVALKAVLKKGLTENEVKEGIKPEVYSEYAHVNEVAAPASALAISDKELLDAYMGAVALDETEIPVEEFEFINGHEYAKTFTAAKEGGYVYAMPYDNNFDLGSLVATCFTIVNDQDGVESVSDHEVLDLEKFGFTYRFSVAQTEFNVTDLASTYNQQEAIECIDDTLGIFRAKLDENDKPITANVGRTPIVRVDLMHGENIVTRAFIKLVINGSREPNMNVYDDVQNVVLACPDTKVERAISAGVLDSLYKALHITEAEFWDVYGVKEVTTTVKKNGEDNNVIPKPVVTATAKSIKWSMTHEQAGKIGNGAKIVTTVTVYDKRVLSALPAEITFVFEVNFKLPEIDPDRDVTAEIKDIYWKGGALQANVNVPVSKTDVAQNCYFRTPIAIQPWKELSARNLPCAATDKYGFRISRVYNIDPTAEDGWSKWTATSGVSIETTGEADVIAADAKEYYIVLDKTNEALKKALNSDKGLMAEVQWYVTAQSTDEWVLHTFLVEFMRPLDFILPDGLEVTDAITGGDVVAFQDKTMLKDWRGELVFGPTFEDVLKTKYIWNKVCSPADHAQWQPAYTIEKTPAAFEVKTQTIKLDDEEVYYVASYQLNQNAELIAWFEKYGDAPVIIDFEHLKILYRPAGTWKTVEVVTGEGRTENEAKANARAAVNQLNAHYLDGRTNCGYSAEFIGTESKIAKPATEIKVVTEVKYTPATYETVEGYFVYSPCNEQPGPAMNGEVYTEGQRIGCWEYQRIQETLKNQKVDPGQYWDFYGPIDESVTLDVTKAYTDLADTKLPAGATLVQSGNTVKYVNVMSPIQYSYHIYIPATIKYGWGTLNQTLEITVNPVKTVAE